MVWISVEDHSAASGPHTAVAASQICLVRLQSAFQLPATFPSLVLLPCGKKMSSWLSSLLTVTNHQPCACSMSYLATFHSSGETQAFIFCLNIFCCHFQASSIWAPSSKHIQKVFSKTSNARKRFKTHNWHLESVPKHRRSLTCFTEKKTGCPTGCECQNLSLPNAPVRGQQQCWFTAVSEYWWCSKLLRYQDTGWK